jgi:uncharacterized protein (DUF1697 family)
VAETKRYAAFLRGVSPMNAKMPDLKKAFESAGFEDVLTVASSGNVVFNASSSSEAKLERAAEAAMKKRLGASFATFVRSVEDLTEMIESEPYARFDVARNAKRIMTFLRQPPEKKPKLPIELDGARILSLKGREVFSAYIPGPRGPVFMTLLERTFGKDITTRTWDAVGKIAKK